MTPHALHVYRVRACAVRLRELCDRLGADPFDTHDLCKLERRITALVDDVNLDHMQAATRRPETENETTLAADHPPAALRRAS